MKKPSEARSRIMRAIKSRNTRPELALRSLAHRMGYRFRLHRSDLPGKPDLVFAGKKKVVFVHGCFWHSHDCRFGARIPATNSKYWKAKLTRTQKRDAASVIALRAMGWKSKIFWECDLRDLGQVAKELRNFLG
jgi:DNA mismatch endonuclease (patch repair protein)